MKRYTVDDYGISYECADGEYVKYEEFESIIQDLEEKNSELESSISLFKIHLNLLGYDLNYERVDNEYIKHDA